MSSQKICLYVFSSSRLSHHSIGSRACGFESLIVQYYAVVFSINNPSGERNSVSLDLDLGGSRTLSFDAVQ